jgi:nickel-type superoxide dismutase maturation protease
MHWPLTRVAVAERSMEPALRPGDWLLVRRTRRVRVGQIVLARHPGLPDLLIVKRAARKVPGGWWLESDNPDAGAVDSRRFGPVPGLLIEGRVLGRYWRKSSLAERAVVRGSGRVRAPRTRAAPSLDGAAWLAPVT